MTRTVYVNGAYMPEDQAKISIFDRAFLFADGVYEVTAVVGGKMVDFDPHIARLHRSLDELEMACPLGDDALREMHEELIGRNGLDEGVVYMQITRGVADRDFTYPEDAEPTVIGFTQVKPLIDSPQARSGVTVVTIPDIRWRRRDIKSTALLAQAMGKQAAKTHDAYEAWMVEDGYVTEGTSSSAFIVTGGDTIVTRQLSNDILPGVTRRAILKLSADAGIAVEERLFTVDEAKAASEAFLTSASSFVLPIVRIDGQQIGDGTPGPVVAKLREVYLKEAAGA
ncbi:MAG: D-amino-acid transaminase [Hyphomicrobiales bacterium]|nr:D-amino-acid transaminase [Hyphomicrobiales bacterium]